MSHQSTFHYRYRTLPDNTLFWSLVDYLRQTGHVVEHNIPNMMPGCNADLYARPYPHPREMQNIKLIIAKIEKLIHSKKDWNEK